MKTVLRAAAEAGSNLIIPAPLQGIPVRAAKGPLVVQNHRCGGIGSVPLHVGQLQRELGWDQLSRSASQFSLLFLPLLHAPDAVRGRKLINE